MERNIRLATIVVDSTACAASQIDRLLWLCLTCFRGVLAPDPSDETAVDSRPLLQKMCRHGNTAKHYIMYTREAPHLFCVLCKLYIDLSAGTCASMNAKQRQMALASLDAVKALLSPPVSPAAASKCETPGGSRCGPEDPRAGRIEPDTHMADTQPHMAQDSGICSSRPAGLANLGNTCFMNATLQALASLDLPPLPDEYPGPVSHSLYSLLGELSMRGSDVHNSTKCKGKRSGRAVINPSLFFKSLCQCYDFFSENGQQDSHDFLRLLFNALDDELMGKDDAKPHERLFRGELCVRVKCNACCTASTTREPCMDLSLALNRQSDDRDQIPSSEDSLAEYLSRLSVKHSDRGLQLKDLLDFWMQPQLLQHENAFACPVCFQRDSSSPCDPSHTKPTTAIFQSFVSRPPMCLLLHFQRFVVHQGKGLKTSAGGRVGKKQRKRADGGFAYSKNQTPVMLPLTLDLSPWIIGASGPVLYRLRSVVVHEGQSPDSGHYTALISKDQKAWYKTSDESVTVASQTHIASAYMAFYQRVSAGT